MRTVAILGCIAACAAPLVVAAAGRGDTYCAGAITMQLDWQNLRMTLSGTEETAEFDIGPPLGTGLNGRTITSHDPALYESGILYHTTIVMDATLTPPDERRIMIFNDVAYWPCK